MVEALAVACSEDLIYLADNMRDIERRECLATGFSSPLAGLSYCVAVSDAYYVFKYDNRPFCIVGLSRKQTDGRRCLWMSGTSEISRHKKEFILRGRAVIGKWLDMYSEFYFMITTENKATIRWLKSLGGEAGEPFYMGGQEFVKVSLKRGVK